MANIQFIVGTVMGTAMEVADTIRDTLTSEGHSVAVDSDFTPPLVPHGTSIGPDHVFLLCTSNTGMGDLPANIAPLYQHLKNDPPVMVDCRYGIVNLGDSSYPNFAQAGQTLDEAMADLGAKRLGDPLVLDAMVTDDYTADAIAWAIEWSNYL